MNTNPYYPQVAGDDLCRMANDLGNLRDFLLGVHSNLVPVTEESIRRMEFAEAAVKDMFAPIWQQCQEALARATDADLAETDTTWMGKPMPSYFDTLTVEALRGAVSKVRQLRLVQTNPSTLTAMGKLDE